MAQRLSSPRWAAYERSPTGDAARASCGGCSPAPARAVAERCLGGCCREDGGALRGGSRRRFGSGRGSPVAGGYRRWRARSVGPCEGHEGGECAGWSRVMRVGVGWDFRRRIREASSRCSGQAICENRESTCERLEEAGKCPPERLSPQLRGGLRRSLVWTAVGTHGTRVLAALA